MPASRGNPLRVLVCCGGLGVALIAAPQRVTATLPAYKPTLTLLHWLPIYPLRVMGVLLVILAVGVAITIHRNGQAAWHWSAAMSMYWAFWVVQFTAAAISTGGGWAAPFYALIPAWYAFERATPPRRRKR